MLASAPVFAASFLVTKALTRYESTGTIVLWQGLTISLMSAPLAWAVFAEVPTGSTLAGGLVISAATLWLARREARRG